MLAVGIVLGAANWTPANGISYWHGKTNEYWGLSSNWTAGVVDTASEVAGFDTGRVNQPRVFPGSYNIGALYFYNSGWQILAAGSNSLALRSSTGITCANNSGTNFIYCDIWLGADQQWYVGLNSTLYVSGPIARSYNLTKTGWGILQLGAANTFTGTATVANGTLRVGHSLALPASADVTIDPLGVLDVNNKSATFDTLSGSGDVTLGSGSLAVGNDNGSATFSGVISGTGGLTKAGSGTQILDGSNSYSGPTSIEDGVVWLSRSERLDDATDVSVSAGAELYLDDGVGETIDALDGDGDVTLGANAALAVGGNDGGGTFSGVIGGSGHFYKYGSGTQTLSNACSYAGATRVYGGALSLEGAGECLPNTTELRVVAGAILDLNGRMETVDGLTGDGEIVTDGGRLTVGQFGGGGTFEGVISGTAGSLWKTGTGTQTLTGNNSYTGPTNIYNGKLAVSGTSNRLSALTDVYVAASGTFLLNFVDERISDLTGSGTVTVLGGTLTASGGTFDGIIDGTGGLQTVGSSALTLTGTNEYIGTTTVDGLLIVDGSIASSSWTTVTDRGTLCGSGVVGSVELYGTAAPGTSAGILTVDGDFTTSAGLIQIELGGALEGEYDRLDVDGLLTIIGGDLDVLLIDGFEPTLGDVFNILDWNGRTGVFGNENLPDLGTELRWDASDLYSTGEIRVEAVPEPALLGVIGLALLVVRRKRR